MDDDDNWDLNAVVRSCRAATQTTAAAATNPIMTGPEEDEFFWDWLKPEEVNDPFVSFPSDLLEPRANAFQELQQFYEPFFPNPTTTNNPPTNKSYAPPTIPNSPTISDFGGSAAATSGLQQQHHAQVQQQHQFVPTNNNPIMRPFGYQYHQQPLLLPKPENQILLSHHQPPPGFIGRPSGGPGPMPASGPLPRFPYTIVPYHTPRTTRKKKCQQKREVVEVSAENLSADLWAWRKYGQKPIKGSPHPRNYYRCSSSKGCGARKQVERSVKDPEIFVVTYTGEHTHPRPTHRNSLAGSTRNRLSSTTTSQTQPIINDGSSSTPPTVPSPTAQLADQDAALVNEVNSSGNILGKEIDDEELEDVEGDEMDEDDVMMHDVAAEEEEEEDMFMGQNKQVGCTSSSSGSAGSSWASANHSSSAGATVGGGY